MHRRSFLSMTGIVALPGLAGCLTNTGDHPGSLEISNDCGEAHTVTVTVQKVSEDNDRFTWNPQEDPPTPSTTPLWRRERTFEVPANSDIKETEFITEPGLFFVEVELDTGATASTWLGLSESAAGTVIEDKVEVHIMEDSRLNLYTAAAE